MGRITRAKAAVLSEAMHIDEDLPADQHYGAHGKLATIDEDERTPLGEIAYNRAGAIDGTVKSTSAVESSNANNGAGRKGAKRIRRHEMNDNANANHPGAPVQEPIIIPDENDLPPSPASETAAEDLMMAVPELDMSNVPTHDIKQASPPSNAVRLTRNQLRAISTQPLHRGTETATLADQPAITAFNVDEEALEPTECDFDEPTESLEPLNAHTTSPQSGKGTTDLQPEDTLASNNSLTPKRLTGDALSIITAFENSEDVLNMVSGEPMTPYDELEAAAVEAQTPPRSSRSSSATTAPTSVSDAASEIHDDPNATLQDSPYKLRSKRPGPIVRTTKASQARITLAHGSKDRVQAPSLGRPAPANRVTSNSSTKSTDANDAVERKEVIIPHSKPRPMSMAFPAPSPPPKSTKAPTQSNFQLPGEAIAAKLKAAKDARLQKDVDEQKSKAFKARPIPASVAKGAAVRQTSTSKARETLMTGSKPASSATATTATPVPTSRPASTTRRPHSRATSALAGARPASAAKSHASSTVRGAAPISRPSTAMALNSPSSSSSARPFHHSRNPSSSASSATASGSAPRPASSSSATATATSASGTAKGKEVWNRTAFALEAAEREKRDKEAAARKARAEAAERGRAASREWAEKQRVRKMVARMEANDASSAANTCGSPARAAVAV